MTLTNEKDVTTFLKTINNCCGKITVTSPKGDYFNLNSGLNKYIFISKIAQHQADQYELWCEKMEDEVRFFEMFNLNPQML